MRHSAFIALVFLLASCAGPKFTVETRTGQPIPIDTLNVLAVMIGPMYQPAVPLIDAATFNGKTNKIANEIIRAQEDRIDSLKEGLITTLREKLPVVVRTANELEREGIEAYRVEKAIQSENKNFPLVLFGKGDLSFRQYGKMQNLNKEIESNDELAANVAIFAEKFNLSNVAICYNRLAVISVGPFGGTGMLRLETYILVFNRNGEVIIDATGLLEPISISGKELEDYTSELDKYKVMQNLLVLALSKQIMQ